MAFTVVQINETNINFDPIDDPTFVCKVTIDRDFHSALENIYSTTSITLHCEIRGSIKCSVEQEDVEPQGSGCM